MIPDDVRRATTSFDSGVTEKGQWAIRLETRSFLLALVKSEAALLLGRNVT